MHPVGNAPVSLRIRRLSFSYPQGAVFASFSADFTAGLTWICGEEGCGKTTLLRLVAGDLRPEEGGLSLADNAFRPESPASQHVVYWADPDTHHPESITPNHHFESLVLRYPGFVRSSDREFARVITGLGLQEHAHKPLYMLSTGTKRKVWIAGALLSNAPVILMDEPFAALDRPSISFLKEQLTLAANGKDQTWLVATHEPSRDVPHASVLELPQRA